ncbi:COG4695 Phage-related protein [uncultured Caudovirales phage]|uniref:COG4695 Phage-related protein n=1 Tax=uncultured Caudovirales phage TaxID=2100421 RepID=A0A6J5M4T3_9CAUD|nr:COG4695 Phage-related protein [uncultured Caudovirales phage]
MVIDLFGKKREERMLKALQASQEQTVAAFLRNFQRWFTPSQPEIKDGVEGFATNADVYSIVSYLTLKFSTVPGGLYELKDRKAYDKYRFLIKSGNYKEAAKIQRKEMDEQEVNNPVSRLIKRPNLQQSQDSFFQQVMGFRLTGGAAPIWFNKGESQQGEPIAMHNLVPSLIELMPSQTNPFYIDRFKFDESGLDLEGSYNDLIYWRYWSPEFSITTFAHLYGFSPLAAAAYTLGSNQAAQKAAMSMFNNKGASGVMFPDMGPDNMMPEPQKNKLRKEVNDMINNNDNRGGVVPVGAKVGYIDIGSTAKEMELLQAMAVTKQQLCSIYQFPYHLFDPNTTFNNVAQASKNLITNKIIPEWTSFRDEINTRLIPQFKGAGGYVYEPDFTLLYEMMEDSKMLVDTYGPMYDRGLLSGDEMRELVNFEATGKPEHQEYYINGSYQPLSDISAGVGPLPQNDLLNDE